MTILIEFKIKMIYKIFMRIYISLENETPQISGNTTINVQVNQTAEIRFNISDDGQADPLYVILKQPDNFVLDNQTGIATWTPTNDSVSEIQYYTPLILKTYDILKNIIYIFFNLDCLMFLLLLNPSITNTMVSSIFIYINFRIRKLISNSCELLNRYKILSVTKYD